jgi:hypothetical protein
MNNIEKYIDVKNLKAVKLDENDIKLKNSIQKCIDLQKEILELNNKPINNVVITI